MPRNSLRYVSWKERKAVARELRAIYAGAATREAAEQALDAFCGRWDGRFPSIGRMWRAHWDNLTTFFGHPPEIRRVIYTTNSVESINAQLRKVTKKRGSFPTIDSIRKVLYLAIGKASARWSRPILHWTDTMNHFAVVFQGRVPG